MMAEAAALLSPAQRRGLSCLPDPLPLTASIRELDSADLQGPGRRMLLLAAVCVDDRTDVLLQAAQLTMVELMAMPASRALVLVAGRFRFADPRIRILVHGDADLGSRTEVHRSLAATYRSRGEQERALWHHALATMQGDAALTRPLLRMTARALAAGDAARAHATAREAASHADDATVGIARAVAGRAALAGGWLDDAIAWLAPIVDEGGDEVVRDYSIAMTLRHGTAPAAAAQLPAEMQRANRFVAGEWSSPQPVNGPMSAALASALDDRIDEGLRILSGAGALPPSSRSATMAAMSAAPLASTGRAVLAALLHTWRGDLRTAYEHLTAAAEHLPVSQVFGGLAVRLARRLELAIDGRVSEFSVELEAIAPVRQHHDRFAERAIAAYLAGRSDEAAVHLRLRAERVGPQAEIALPDVDEVGPAVATQLIGPASALRARQLRLRLRTANTGSLAHELEAVAEEARTIASPYERGRVEALLGIARLTRGESSTASRHLHAASSLFADAGALAWQCAADARLSRIGESPNVDVRTPTTPIPTGGGDPLAVCRSAWESQLTARELQIAMLVSGGAANRSIAEQLHVSVRTVEVHLGRIFRKFDVRTRGELIALAHRTNQHT